MNILFIKIFFVRFMVSEIPKVSVFGYFPLCLSKTTSKHCKDIELAFIHCYKVLL